MSHQHLAFSAFVSNPPLICSLGLSAATCLCPSVPFYLHVWLNPWASSLWGAALLLRPWSSFCSTGPLGDPEVFVIPLLSPGRVQAFPVALIPNPSSSPTQKALPCPLDSPLRGPALNSSLPSCPLGLADCRKEAHVDLSPSCILPSSP
jgi:hypothetical protein